MIAVIADDITGAAEVAGIARRFGLRVRLAIQPCMEPDCDVIVIATDTRSMTEDEAVAETVRVARAIKEMPCIERIFKKTDSALRGHVVAELEALMSVSGCRNALYIPANPSKGRTIRDGIYYIGGMPLHETDFSFDPEFPAYSSDLRVRFPDCREKGIRYTDAVTEEDVRTAIAMAGDDVVPAGAADLFTAFLQRHFSCNGVVDCESHVNLEDCIIVCGSTQSKPVSCGVGIYYMPSDVYNGTAPADIWNKELAKAYGEKHSVILALRDRSRTGKESAVYLRETMAGTVKYLVDIHRPDELIIEGGATAFAILGRLGWDSFAIVREIAPGVIRMRASNGTYVTMKPGSYHWGGLFGI